MLTLFLIDLSCFEKLPLQTCLRFFFVERLKVAYMERNIISHISQEYRESKLFIIFSSLLGNDLFQF